MNQKFVNAAKFVANAALLFATIALLQVIGFALCEWWTNPAMY